MIEFLQDYTTTALPPERFSKGQQVSGRSEASELYFVGLGVAGYVVDGKLVDQNYQPIVASTPVVVVDASADRRFGGGRAGELLGVAAPQRASTGPGNAAVFGGDVVGTGPSQIEFEQLSEDLSAVRQQHDDLGKAHADEMEQMRSAHQDQLRDLNERSLSTLGDIEKDRDQQRGRADRAEGELSDANTALSSLREELTATKLALDELKAAPSLAADGTKQTTKK